MFLYTKDKGPWRTQFLQTPFTFLGFLVFPFIFLFHQGFKLPKLDHAEFAFCIFYLQVMGHEFLSNEEFKTWEVWVDSPASTLPPQEVKVFSPDYVTVDRDTAVKDFRKRIKHYEDAYEPLSVEKEG